MSAYMTEDEQLELIKKWWQRYGNMITFALSVVLLCIGGYRIYNWHHAKMTQQASSTYEKMMSEFSNQNTKAVRSFANELISNYGSTVYADGAHLTLAKMYTAKDESDKAIKELQAVATHSKMTPLKQIAKIRIARIQAANQSYTEALNTISQVEDKSYLPVINELKGDIYGAQGQFEQAIKAYRLAMNEVKTKGMGNLYLENENQ